MAQTPDAPRFASERERAEHLFMLYEEMRVPLGVGVQKLKRRRR